MSDKTKVEKSTNADGKSVSQPIAKPFVVRSPKLSKLTNDEIMTKSKFYPKSAK